MSDEEKSQAHVAKPKTKEQELTQGLKDTFPASDPVSLESKTIAAKKPKLVGVEEVLKQKAEAEKSEVPTKRAVG